ncbi:MULTISPECIES: CoA ester lyase [unclassified Caballeronia]|uniref:HpcH/HpaI aldolase/citrate lyase family protein n=1 Tax=unclassified Caballeronia TaxID=2646786 RepID=UPI0020280479|nr:MULTISPECIES: CoA ester lyase [unclassified Caballeronia]MDR5765886.1 CoA ester lyase [Caballeronia sp. LZ028]
MYPKSYLFVPGNRPERFDKAFAAGADAVILDLEDAVPYAAKAQAREAVVTWLKNGGSAYVRVNAADTTWYQDDIEALLGCRALRGIVVPKAERADVLANLSKMLSDSTALLLLIETAAAFDNLNTLARTPKVERLMFGTIDFQVDTGIKGDGDELIYFRSQLTLASRIAGIAAPVDGVTPAIDDVELLRQDTIRARNLGFRGKLCIHPKQLAPVHAAFLPPPEDIEWAQRVLSVAHEGDGSAISVDGKMVDAPVIAKAKDILNNSAAERA